MSSEVVTLIKSMHDTYAPVGTKGHIFVSSGGFTCFRPLEIPKDWPFDEEFLYGCTREYYDAEYAKDLETAKNEQNKLLQSVSKPRKPSRVRKFKEDYVNEVTILRVDNHSLKCKLECITVERDDFYKMYSEYHDQLNNPTITQAVRQLVKAVVRKVRGV